MNNKLIYVGKPDDEIAKYLERRYTIEYYNGTIEEDISTLGILMDFNDMSMDNKIINGIITSPIKYPIIFLNVNNSEPLYRNYGIGLSSKAIVVTPATDFDVFDIIDFQYDGMVNPSIIFQDCKKAYTVNNPMNTNYHYNYNEPVKVGDKIIEIITSKVFLPMGATTKPDLPENQYKQIFLRLNHEAEISSGSTQMCSNETILEICLYASYKPDQKYLRVRNLGKGINPGYLTCNSNFERGWFQGQFNITIEPKNKNVTLLSNEPSSLRQVSSCDVASKFIVGVNEEDNPVYNESYEIESSEKFYISDFEVENKSVTNKASWNMKLIQFKKGIFYSSSNGESYVKELPNSAISNIKPVTNTVWKVSNTFNDVVGFTVKLQEDFFYVSKACPEKIYGPCIGNCQSVGQSYGCYDNKILKINFNIVNC